MAFLLASSASLIVLVSAFGHNLHKDTVSWYSRFTFRFLASHLSSKSRPPQIEDRGRVRGRLESGLTKRWKANDR